jgi:hypothetical protein
MDFAPYYRTSIKKSVDEDRALIVAGFQDILKRGMTVGIRLVSYYKGLPLSYPATLVEVDRGVLEMDVHKQQAVALSANRHTFIKCDYFDSAILAEAQNVNVRSMTASLRNFTFVRIMAENRNSLRLELEPPTDAEIDWNGNIVKGRVIDLSLGGFSIEVSESIHIPDRTEVPLTVMVPNLLQNTVSRLQTKAKHVGTNKGAGSDICRFSFEADPVAEGLLSRFIFQRQVEIIRELKEKS